MVYEKRLDDGVLDEDDTENIVAAIGRFPNIAVCTWGYGPEWKYIDAAGRRTKDGKNKRVDDGSYGINLVDAIKQVPLLVPHPHPRPDTSPGPTLTLNLAGFFEACPCSQYI